MNDTMKLTGVGGLILLLVMMHRTFSFEASNKEVRTVPLLNKELELLSFQMIK